MAHEIQLVIIKTDYFQLGRFAFLLTYFRAGNDTDQTVIVGKFIVSDIQCPWPTDIPVIRLCQTSLFRDIIFFIKFLRIGRQIGFSPSLTDRDIKITRNPELFIDIPTHIGRVTKGLCPVDTVIT